MVAGFKLVPKEAFIPVVHKRGKCNQVQSNPLAETDWRDRRSKAEMGVHNKRDKQPGKGAALPLPGPVPGKSYIPPHLRSPLEAFQPQTPPRSRALRAESLDVQVQRTLFDAQTPPPRKGPKHDRLYGPLRPVAIDMFQRFYGLNGNEQVSFEVIFQECNREFNVTEKAVRSLLLGHTHDDLLGELRKQVPDYPQKEKTGRGSRGAASKSCGSSPMTLGTQPQPEVESFSLCIGNLKLSNLEPRSLFSVQLGE